MEKRTKKFLWAALAFAGPVLLLILVSLLLVLVVNLQPIKNRIQKELSEKIGGQLRSERIELALLPAPHVSFHNFTLAIPEKLTGTVHQLSVYPALLPLLKGEIRIARARLVAPELKAELADRPLDIPELVRSLLRNDLDDLLNQVASVAPGLSVRIEDGKLQLWKGEKMPFQFNRIEAHLSMPPKNPELALSCESNLWKSISLKARVDDNLALSGTIHAVELRPQVLADAFFPSSTLQIVQARASLNVGFSSANLKNLDFSLQGSIPSVILRSRGEQVMVKCPSLKGTLKWDESRLAMELQEMLLDTPHLALSGTFLQGKDSGCTLDVKGTDIDVDATRKTALSLLGQFPITEDIFKIVTGGTVPVITFHSRGGAARELGHSDNIHITGAMQNGNIFVPKPGLALTEVYGEVDITRGILKGEKLRARLKNSRALGGSLLIGLGKGDQPFHLDLTVDADLAQLPPILHRVVPDKRFKREMELIDSFQGHGKGRFVLGESLDSVKTLVEVEQLQLTASYRRIPYPVHIESGRFYYDGIRESVSVKDLAGTLGSSSFEAVSGSVAWPSEMQLQVSSKRADLSVPEVYPWIVSYPELAERLKEFKLAKGTVAVKELDLKGPLLKPGKWQFKVIGSAMDLSVDWKLFPGTLSIVTGDFEGAPHTLTLTDTKARMLDASFTATARLDEFLHGFSGAELAITGSLGAKAIDWIAGLSDLPSQFRLRPPLAVTRGRLIWKRNSETSFAGELLPAGGPKVTLDQVWRKEGLLIKKLLIEDQESTASISLDLKPQAFDLTFSGNLTKSTVDQLLQSNQMLTGWLRGDFSAHISLEKYLVSTAMGDLEGQGVRFPQLKELDEIKHFSVKATNGRLSVNSATLVCADKQFVVSGTIDLSANSFLLDLKASVDGILWTEVERILRLVKEGAKITDQMKRTEILGDIEVRSGFFGFAEYTWKPLQANVHFTPAGIEVKITKATLCDISTTGTLETSPNDFTMRLKAEAQGQQLNPTLSCLWQTPGLMEGGYSFDADLTGHLMQNGFIESLQGGFTFNAIDGRIYRFGLLEKIFSVLNFTEIFRGKLPNLEQEGFGYESFEMKGNLHDGKINIEEAIIKGSSMELVGRGVVDMISKKIDATVLVAPLKTLSVIISYIPLVNGILGHIVSIPVQVTGDLSDPTVIPLSPSAVGSDLLGIMKKTIELPMRIIQPLLPEEANE